MGKIGLIIEREFMQRVRKKSFLVVTLLMPLAMVALVLVPMLITKYSGDDEKREIVVLDGSGVIASNLKSEGNLNFTTDSISYAEALLKYPSSFGFLEVGADIVENPASMKLYTRKASTMAIEGEIKGQVSRIITENRIAKTGIADLSQIMNSVIARAQLQTFEVSMVAQNNDQHEVKEKSTAANMGVAYVSSFLIYMFVLVYGMMVLQGVVEEKSSRIIEVIVSSVRPFELMMGKILGIALVALLQFIVWIVVGGVVLALLPSVDGSSAAMASGAAGSMAPDAMGGLLSTLLDPWFLIKIVGSFIVFFVGGYLLYAAMFAAIGSAVDNVADTQQLQMPVTLPLIVAIVVMLSVMQNPYSSAAFWFSIIPFTSPIIMMARISYGVPVWEYVLSVVVLYGTFVAMTALAAKIYRTGIFMYGKKPSLKEIIKWARYKG